MANSSLQIEPPREGLLNFAYVTSSLNDYECHYRHWKTKYSACKHTHKYMQGSEVQDKRLKDKTIYQESTLTACENAFGETYIYVPFLGITKRTVTFKIVVSTSIPTSPNIPWKKPLFLPIT